MTMHKLKGRSKERHCDTCGKLELVRTDNKSTTCRFCSRRAAAKSSAMKKQCAVPWFDCAHCGLKFQRSARKIERAENSFCSLACKVKHSRIERQCKGCSKKFFTQRGRVSSKTNSTAKFCSRPCYNTWLCQTDRINGRGSQWKSIRELAISRYPFCAICGSGRKRRLEVHHILPYRLSLDNSQPNLIPLCSKHHKSVETILHSVEATGIDHDTVKLFFWSVLKERQAATFMKIKELSRQHEHQHR